MFDIAANLDLLSVGIAIAGMSSKKKAASKMTFARRLNPIVTRTRRYLRRRNCFA